MKLTASVLSLVLSAAMAVSMLAGCGAGSTADTESDASSPPRQSEAVGIGQGSISFIFEVTDNDGNTSIWNVNTDQTTVGAALLENGMISGDESDFGLMVTHVNGLRADYNEDGAYWAFLIDGEYASYGVDATDIEQGKVYAFVYTPA